MKSSFGISLLVHAAVLSLLLVSARLSANMEPRPVVYRVNLVEPVVEPAIEEAPPAPPARRPVPREVPEIRVRHRRARDVKMKAPAAAPETPLRVEHRERRKERREPPPPARKSAVPAETAIDLQRYQI